MRIYTARYQNHPAIIESGAAPVRTTLGNPRMALKYPILGNVQMLAPDRAWFRASDAVFEMRYEQKLEGYGVDRIRQALWDIDSGRDVVLLCFENVTVDPLACHRRLFARWWETQTGEVVAELVDKAPTRKPRANSITLLGKSVSEAVYRKATGLIQSDRLQYQGEGIWSVQGDSGRYRVTEDDCSCPTDPRLVCSHRLAVLMSDSEGRLF